MSLAIGIDLGGTNVRAALVDQNGTILAESKRKTLVVNGPEACVQSMVQMIAELKALSPEKIFGVGIGSPGPLSRHERMIFQTPNLPGFDGFPLGTRVEELSGLPVLLDNDAKCATYGEGLFGVAKGMDNFVLLTFGTGIGGGVINNSQMIYGKSDGACEIGHMTLYPGGELCKCQNLGCFEAYCSATAVERRAELKFSKSISNVELILAAERNETWSTDFLHEVAVDMAIATASIVNIFDPNAVVFGGGLFSSGGGPLCAYVQEEIKDRCFKSSQLNLKIVPSALKGEAGVLGAASLVYRAKTTSSAWDQHLR